MVPSGLNGVDKQNAIIRNLCFGAVNKCVFLSYYSECMDRAASDTVIHGLSLSELQEYRDVDCFEDDLSVAKKIVQRLNRSMYDMYFPDMDQIISQILSGTMPDLVTNGTIDASPSVCWDSNSQGDNIWHALVRMDMDLGSLANMCASVASTNIQDAFFIATIYAMNHAGESPIHEAIRTNHTKLINWLKGLLHQDRATCIKLADEIYSQTERELPISLSKIKRLFGC